MNNLSITELKENLAAANRILVRNKVLDAYGHVSVRHPEDSGRFFISRNLAPQSVTAEDIQEFTLEGKTDDTRKPYLEVFIHSEIYAQRPEVHAIVHSHAASVVPFAISSTSMPCVSHMAGFLAQGVPVFEIRDKAGTATDLLITDRERGEALADALGGSAVALLRGHGAVIAGETLAEVVHRSVFTVFNAKACIEASSLGGEILSLTREEGESAMQSNRPQIERAWNLWLSEDQKQYE